MMEEPYRWIEAIGNRREYIEDQLRQGSPIVLLEYNEGLLLFTVSREARKIFEVYDRIVFAGLGHPADIERLRLAAIDLAHVEGFNRAVHDVSLRRLVSFGLSPALKQAFEHVFGAPFIVKMLLAELGETADGDVVVKLDYDGSFGRSGADARATFEVLAGTAGAERQMVQYLQGQSAGPRNSVEEALRVAARTWTVGQRRSQQTEAAAAEEGQAEKLPGDEELVKLLREHLRTRHVEAAVMDRRRPTAGKFRLLADSEVRAALKDL